jgi:hypothetical protein
MVKTKVDNRQNQERTVTTRAQQVSDGVNNVGQQMKKKIKELKDMERKRKREV